MILKNSIYTLVPLSLLVSCSTQHQKQEMTIPNILLIVSEDNGPELSCYGDKNVKTPNIDKLADEGIRFNNAYITHAVCSASRASILTGLYPHQNGQIALATHGYSMFKEFPNIPSILKNSGYRTGIIGKLHVNPKVAFPFDFKWNDPSKISFNHRDIKTIAEKANEFITSSDVPFFLMLNYADAHFPLLTQSYGLPEDTLVADDVEMLPFIGINSDRILIGVANYYNCLKRLDTGVGMLMEKLQRSRKDENTMIIYIGDHGAQFSRGKATCYEGGTKIPFIINWKGVVKKGIVLDDLTSTIDILPTILEAAGIENNFDLPGHSLLGKNPETREFLVTERTAFSSGSFYPQRTIRNERYKLIYNLIHNKTNPVAGNYRNQLNSFFMYGTSQKEINEASKYIQEAYKIWENPPEFELYDLQSDPYEFNNLSEDSTYIKIKFQLIEALEKWQIETNDQLRFPEKLRLLEEEHKFVFDNFINHKYPTDSTWKYLRYLNF